MSEFRTTRTMAIAVAIIAIGGQPLASDAFAGQTGGARPMVRIVKPVPPMPDRFQTRDGGGTNVGLLRPAVQAAREAARPAPPPPSNNDDCMSCAD